jgi:hypothetical protein
VERNHARSLRQRRRRSFRTVRQGIDVQRERRPHHRLF